MPHAAPTALARMVPAAALGLLRRPLTAQRDRELPPAFRRLHLALGLASLAAIAWLVTPTALQDPLVWLLGLLAAVGTHVIIHFPGGRFLSLDTFILLAFVVLEPSHAAATLVVAGLLAALGPNPSWRAAVRAFNMLPIQHGPALLLVMATRSWLPGDAIYAPVALVTVAILGQRAVDSTLIPLCYRLMSPGDFDYRSFMRNDYPVVLLQSAAELPSVSLAAYAYMVSPYTLGLVVVLVTMVWLVGRQRTDLAAAQRSLRTDPVTGLANRRGLLEWLDHELGQARRYGHDLAIVVGDLDDFKRVNDTLGHQAGDEVLRACAREIEAVCEGNGLAARFGGEEFALCFAAMTRPQVRTVADRLRAAIENADVGGCTISLGVAFLEDLDEASDLMSRADEAMYVAKRGGKNAVVVHGDLRWRMSARVDAIEELVHELQHRSAMNDAHALLLMLEEHRLHEWAARVRVLLVDCMLACGQLEDALELARVSTEAATAAGGEIAVLHRCVLAKALLDSGELHEAATAIRVAQQLAPMRSEEDAVSALILVRARLQARQGELPAATESVTRLAEADATTAAAAAAWLARLAGWHGDETALAAALSLVEQLPDATSPFVRLCAFEVRAVRDAMRGESAVLAGEVIDRWHAAGRPVDACRATIVAGRIDQRSGRGDGEVLMRAGLDRLRSAGYDGEVEALADVSLALDEGTTQRVPLFSDLPRTEREAITSTMATRRFERGEVLFTPHRPSHSCYLVTTGRVRLFRTSDSGRQFTVAVLQPGDVFGESAATADDRWLSAEAMDDGECFVIPANRIADLVDRYPRVARTLMQLAGRRLDDALERAEQLGYWPVRRRLANLLLQLADQHGHPTLSGGMVIDKVVTQNDLVEHVVATRAAINSALADFRSNGWLGKRGRRFELLDVDALRAVADGGESIAA